VRGAAKNFVIALLACLEVSAVAAASTSDTNAPITWVFLNTGAGRDKTKGLSSEEVGKMQAAHVGNFGALFEKSKLYAAGPLGDNGTIRGIVVLNVSTPSRLRIVKTDPFIQNDILAVEAHPWRDIMNWRAQDTPNGPNTLCIRRRAETGCQRKRNRSAGLLILPGAEGERGSRDW
jgi:hypothetical protein